MKRYVIERELPDIGNAGSNDLREAATKSNAALAELGKAIQWVESYVVADRTFCIYLDENEEWIRRHSEISGFPATRICEVKRIIDPTTADAVVRLRT